MKKTLLLLAFTAFISVLHAQDAATEEMDYIQSIYGMEKKQIVSQFLKLEDAQKADFWTVYDEYEVKRKELGKQRIKLLTYLDENNANLSNEMADEWMKEIIKLGNDTQKLLTLYYKKVKKVTNPITAAQFYQVESYLLTAQRFGIQDSLPVVGGQLN